MHSVSSPGRPTPTVSPHHVHPTPSLARTQGGDRTPTVPQPPQNNGGKREDALVKQNPSSMASQWVGSSCTGRYVTPSATSIASDATDAFSSHATILDFLRFLEWK